MAAPRRNNVGGNRPDILYRIHEMKIHDLIKALKDDQFVMRIASEESKSLLEICHADHDANIRGLLDNTMRLMYQIMEDLMKFNSERKYFNDINDDDRLADPHIEFNKKADFLITQLDFIRQNVDYFYALIHMHNNP